MTSTSGFTLIETLVAMALTAMLAVTGTTLMIQTSNASAIVKQQTDISKRLDIAHTLMRDDFANATGRQTAVSNELDTSRGFIGKANAGSKPFIMFTRANWLRAEKDEQRGDLQRLEYRLEDGALIRRAWLRPDAVRQTPYVDRVLENGITAIDANYYAGMQLLPAWDNQTPLLPNAIELKITYQNSNELALTFLVGGGG